MSLLTPPPPPPPHLLRPTSSPHVAPLRKELQISARFLQKWVSAHNGRIRPGRGTCEVEIERDEEERREKEVRA